MQPGTKAHYRIGATTLSVRQKSMLRPIGDHILVKPLEASDVTKSGIVLADSAQQKPQEGTVLAVGNGKYVDGKLVSFADMGIKAGDVVMFTKYGPTEIKIDGNDYFVIDSNDVLGVVEGKSAK